MDILPTPSSTPPDWMTAALRSVPRQYQLSGGSTCNVFRSDPEPRLPYFAEVFLRGRYPESEAIAHNHNRVEEVLVLEGAVTVSRDGVRHDLAENQSIVLKSGTRYAIEGQARLLVLVLDGVGAESKIEEHELHLPTPQTSTQQCDDNRGSGDKAQKT